MNILHVVGLTFILAKGIAASGAEWPTGASDFVVGFISHSFIPKKTGSHQVDEDLMDPSIPLSRRCLYGKKALTQTLESGDYKRFIELVTLEEKRYLETGRVVEMKDLVTTKALLSGFFRDRFNGGQGTHLKHFLALHSKELDEKHPVAYKVMCGRIIRDLSENPEGLKEYLGQPFPIPPESIVAGFVDFKRIDSDKLKTFLDVAPREAIRAYMNQLGDDDKEYRDRAWNEIAKRSFETGPIPLYSHGTLETALKVFSTKEDLEVKWTESVPNFKELLTRKRERMAEIFASLDIPKVLMGIVLDYNPLLLSWLDVIKEAPFLPSLQEKVKPSSPLEIRKPVEYSLMELLDETMTSHEKAAREWVPFSSSFGELEINVKSPRTIIAETQALTQEQGKEVGSQEPGSSSTKQGFAKRQNKLLLERREKMTEIFTSLSIPTVPMGIVLDYHNPLLLSWLDVIEEAFPFPSLQENVKLSSPLEIRKPVKSNFKELPGKIMASHGKAARGWVPLSSSFGERKINVKSLYTAIAVTQALTQEQGNETGSQEPASSSTKQGSAKKQGKQKNKKKRQRRKRNQK